MFFLGARSEIRSRGEMAQMFLNFPSAPQSRGSGFRLLAFSASFPPSRLQRVRLVSQQRVSDPGPSDKPFLWRGSEGWAQAEPARSAPSAALCSPHPGAVTPAVTPAVTRPGGTLGQGWVLPVVMVELAMAGFVGSLILPKALQLRPISDGGSCAEPPQHCPTSLWPSWGVTAVLTKPSTEL